MIVTIPVHTVSEANIKEHWVLKSRRAKTQRNIAYLLTRNAGFTGFPNTITLTRCASRRLDTDNLARSMKAIRDGIADALGVNDGDMRIDWRYGHEKAKRNNSSVKVEIS